jgi:hypothetical protein
MIEPIVEFQQKHGTLVELSERAARLPNWLFVTGMAILRDPYDLLHDVPPVRIVEWSGSSMLVLDPKSGLQRLDGLFEPVIDLSDPLSFGYLIGQCAYLDDYEADKVYELFDCGNLAASANVILGILEDSLPF